DLGQAQVARITLQEISLGRLKLRPHQGQPFAGPGIGAAIDRVNAGEAGAAQGLGRGAGALADLADQQYLGLRVRQVAGRIGLQLGAAHAERALGLAGDAFVRLADVDQQHALPLAFAGLPRRPRYAVNAPDYRRQWPGGGSAHWAAAAQRCVAVPGYSGSTSTRSPAAYAHAPSSSTISASLAAAARSRCEPSAGSGCTYRVTSSSWNRRPRRNSKRSWRLCQGAARRARQRGRGSRPCSASTSARANTWKVASTDTGLPGRPSTSARPASPNSSGMPGRMRTFQKWIRPRDCSQRGRWSFSPADTAPQVSTRSKFSTASSSTAAISTGSSGNVGQATGSRPAARSCAISCSRLLL